MPQMQNGWTAAILKNQKSQYLYNKLTDFDEIRRGEASWPSGLRQPIKFHDFQNPRWRTAAILKIEEITISRKQLDRFQQNLVR